MNLTPAPASTTQPGTSASVDLRAPGDAPTGRHRRHQHPQQDARSLIARRLAGASTHTRPELWSGGPSTLTGDTEPRPAIRGLLQAAGMAPSLDDDPSDDAAGLVAVGLPLVELFAASTSGSRLCVVTTIDDRGRLADRTPLRAMGWEPGTPITLATLPAVGIILARRPGTSTVTRQGYLRLPASIRHDCRLVGGERLLLIPHPEQDTLVAYTPSAIQTMIDTYHTAAIASADPSPTGTGDPS